MALDDIKKIARSAVQQISSRFTNSHGTNQPTSTPRQTAPIYNRPTAAGNSPPYPLRYGFPTPTVTRSTQTSGGWGAPPHNSATSAGHPGVNHHVTSGRSNSQHHYENISNPYYQNIPASSFHDAPESYYQNLARSVPPLPPRPVAIANPAGSNYGQVVASSLAQNQGNGNQVVSSSAEANNSIVQPGYPAGSRVAASDIFIQPQPRGPAANSLGSNYNQEVASLMARHHGNRMQSVASNAQANNSIVQPGYPVGPTAASNTNVRELARNFGSVQQNSNEPASNTFVRKPADFPLQASSVQARIAELGRRGVNLASSHANPVQPNFQSTMQVPFAASGPTAQNNATNAGPSIFPKLKDPRDFVLPTPPMPNIYGSSRIEPSSQPFNGSQSLAPLNRAQPLQPYNVAQTYNNNVQANSNGQTYNNAQSANPSMSSYEDEVARLMSGPRYETTVPYGTRFGVGPTAAGPELFVGSPLPTNATELNEFPVGVTQLGTWSYRSENASGTNAYQARPNQGDFPLNTRF